MKSALPFLLLSGIALALWFKPGGRLLLTVQEMRAVMEVEGVALFACVFLSVAINAVLRKSDAPVGERELTPVQGFLFLFFFAFVILGSAVGAVGGLGLVVAYWMVLVLHVIGTIRLTERELRLQAAANGWGMFAFIGLGFLAIKAHIFPMFGNNSYPSFDGFWGFTVEGQQIPGWACAHFAALGYLHSSKERIFGRLVDRQLELERKR